ncbi:hypothetical protein PFDG_05190, partial [Plasmodium falciparum Dd2]
PFLHIQLHFHSFYIYYFLLTGKEDIQSINNGTYTQCSLCGIIHKDPHKQKLSPLRKDQYSREG